MCFPTPDNRGPNHVTVSQPHTLTLCPHARSVALCALAAKPEAQIVCARNVVVGFTRAVGGLCDLLPKLLAHLPRVGIKEKVEGVCDRVKVAMPMIKTLEADQNTESIKATLRSMGSMIFIQACKPGDAEDYLEPRVCDALQGMLAKLIPTEPPAIAGLVPLPPTTLEPTTPKPTTPKPTAPDIFDVDDDEDRPSPTP